MNPHRFAWIVAALLSLGTLSCGSAFDALCDVPGCEFSSHEWELLQGLAQLPDPPPDSSNAFSNNAAVALLGQRFYFDPAFSGPSTFRDALNRPSGGLPQSPSVMGTHMGQSVQLSCASCHD